MKKVRLFIATLFIMCATAISAQPMNYNAMRNNARFLTDRMAFTLGITTGAIIDDLYRINYDYICGVNDYLDDVALGYYTDEYNELCYERDRALQYLLGTSMWNRLLGYDYFYRPIVFANRGWRFGIYSYDMRFNYFYRPMPNYFADYRGGHFFGGMDRRGITPMRGGMAGRPGMNGGIRQGMNGGAGRMNGNVGGMNGGAGKMNGGVNNNMNNGVNSHFGSTNGTRNQDNRGTGNVNNGVNNNVNNGSNNSSLRGGNTNMGGYNRGSSATSRSESNVRSSSRTNGVSMNRGSSRSTNVGAATRGGGMSSGASRGNNGGGFSRGGGNAGGNGGSRGGGSGRR